MLNELGRFYEIIIKHDDYKKMIHITNNICWIDVFVNENNGMSLGVAQTGKWVINDEKTFQIISDKKGYLYCVNMLEVPYEEIKAQVERKFESIMENEKIDLFNIVPIIQLIEFAFVNLKNDYWFELAMGWYENLELPIQYKLIDLFQIVSKTRKFSQRNRQRARKEVKKLENLKD